MGSNWRRVSAKADDDARTSAPARIRRYIDFPLIRSGPLPDRQDIAPRVKPTWRIQKVNVDRPTRRARDFAVLQPALHAVAPALMTKPPTNSPAPIRRRSLRGRTSTRTRRPVTFGTL